MKNYLYRSPALKSDVKTGIASDDLYLKGQGYDSSGKPVNLDETFRLESGLSGAQGQMQHRWQLTVYQSGGINIGEVSSGHGDSYGDDNIVCNGSGVFESTKKRDGVIDQWDGTVTKVTFKLNKCGNAGGRRECDIEIE